MNEAQQDNHETLKISTSSDPHHFSKTLLLGLAALLIIIIASGIGYYLGTNNQAVQQKTSPNQRISTPEPTKTIDQTLLSDPTPQPGSSARKIIYARINGWSDFSSNTGYSIQHPTSFTDNDNSGEVWLNESCSMFFGNNAGGILSTTVSPYNGGSRRQLYGTVPGYTYQFEEVVIQGKNSLLIERGPIGDSGSGTGAVIPVGNMALILSWSNRGKDNPEVMKLLQSVKINNQLDLTKCARTTEDVTFSGIITDISYGCFGDTGGVCIVTVDSTKQVQVAVGKVDNGNREMIQKGQLVGLTLNQADKQQFIGKKVEVLAKGPYTNSCSIFDDSKYYVKVTQ